MSAYLDACPHCGRRDNEPVDTERAGTDSVSCEYECRRCGHAWRTSWSISAVWS